MRFVYLVEDVLYGVRERYPLALPIATMVLILGLFAYAGSMDYEDAQRDAQIANEMARQEQYWQDYKQVHGWR